MNTVPLIKSAGISVCIPDKNLSKKYSILKFKIEDRVDLKSSSDVITLERENNLREFKSANDIDLMPKSGAGSEYGREQREEARRKKFGMRSRKYNPKDQPWIFKMGVGEQGRKFRGVRSGGVSENASYFVLMSDPSKNKFVAFPVDEWYDFALLPNNNCLTAEQAEEEFNRRGNVHNHFAIMVNQKIQATKTEELKNEGTFKKGRRKNKLLVSEFDEIDDNDDENDDEDDPDVLDDNGQSKKAKKGKAKAKRGKSKKKKGDDDDDEDLNKEADEESDELDEGQELDYISGSSSNDEGMYDDDEGRDKSETYRDSGVAEEEGLRKLVESDEDDDDEEKKKNEDGIDDDKDDDEDGKLDKSKDSNEASESDSTSDSDDDPDRYGLPNKDQLTSSQWAKSIVRGKDNDDIKPGNSSHQSNNDKIAKRKSKTNQIVSNLNKKIKLEESISNMSSTPVSSFTTQGNIANEMEAEIKKYLERKPMTVVALAKKIWSKFQTRMTTQNFEAVMGEVIKKMALRKTSKNNETLLSIH